MPRPCTVCNHPKVLQIDAWIVQGVSSAEIARRAGNINKSSVHRHRLKGMHLTSPSERLAAEEEQGKFRAYNRKVRTGLKAELRAQQAVPAYEPPYEPPIPPPAAPQPINPPDKVFTESEMRAVMNKVRANKRRPLRLPGYGR
jgi:hypothetical protein